MKAHAVMGFAIARRKDARKRAYGSTHPTKRVQRRMGRSARPASADFRWYSHGLELGGTPVMMALNKMDYTAVSFGKNELGLGLIGTLAEFALNESKPRVVAANLKNRDTTFSKMVASGVV